MRLLVCVFLSLLFCVAYAGGDKNIPKSVENMTADEFMRNYIAISKKILNLSMLMKVPECSINTNGKTKKKEKGDIVEPLFRADNMPKEFRIRYDQTDKLLSSNNYLRSKISAVKFKEEYVKSYHELINIEQNFHEKVYDLSMYYNSLKSLDDDLVGYDNSLGSCWPRWLCSRTHCPESHGYIWNLKFSTILGPETEEVVNEANLEDKDGVLSLLYNCADQLMLAYYKADPFLYTAGIDRFSADCNECEVSEHSEAPPSYTQEIIKQPE